MKILKSKSFEPYSIKIENKEEHNIVLFALRNYHEHISTPHKGYSITKRMAQSMYDKVRTAFK